MEKKNKMGSQYIKYSKGISKNNIFLKISIIFFVFIISFGGILIQSNFTSKADSTDDANSTITKAMKSSGISDNQEGFDKALEMANKNADKNTFAYVIQRLFTIYYINDVSEGVAQSGKSNPGYVCDTDAPGAGTLIYHNCDIPNIMTEFLQDIASDTVKTGMSNAEVTNAALDNAWFGLPSNIPGDGKVPVNEDERGVKYTALEIFGYNLKYTSYDGEWDHIKVMTNARTLSNFGLMDDIKLGTTSIVNGITSGTETAVQNFGDNISQGNILGAVGGFFGGLFEGGASSTINTVLDTSDLNVVNNDSWYRVDFGNTLYGARELTQTEISAMMTQEIVNMFSQSEPDNAKLPADLLAVEKAPPGLDKNISKCTIKDASGNMTVVGDTKNAPGISKDECTQAANAALSQRKSNNNSDDNDSAVSTWSKDGSQKKETLSEWKTKNKSYLDAASKYDVDCTLPSGDADAAVAAYQACWPNAWTSAVQKEKINQQTSLDTTWLNNLLSVSNMVSWFTSDSGRNFNAPWNRYICTDSNGNDMHDSNGNYIFLYNDQGKKNSACSNVRSPIQNGFFGNGYLSDQKQPEQDTRYTTLEKNFSFTNTILPSNAIPSTISDFGLNIIKFTTRISNTFINLSFSPILKSFGMDKIIVKIMTGFRDSLFFPLAVLVIAFGAISVLIKAARSRNYMKQLVSILLMCLTFFVGVIIMYHPEDVVNFVDDVPSTVETTIMGTIYGVANNNEDQLCSSSNTVTTGGSDISGKTVTFSPSASVRTLMCENWRLFAFDPYIYGQWGTNYSNLYASNTHEKNKFKNTNTDLVGDADVKMGGGVTIKNWGLYQLKVTSSGTSTTQDLSRSTGKVDPNTYRIVDAQAGPNNGAGTDSRYLNSWSGNNMLQRVNTSLLGAVTSLFGAFVVSSFSITKIIISVISTLMLIFIPFVFLIGLEPNKGRSILIKYCLAIVGMMLQRIIMVTMLAMLFRLLLGVGTSITGYFLISIVTIALSVIFIKYRDDILRFIQNSSSGKFGTFNNQAINNPMQFAKRFVPKSMKQIGSNMKAYAVGAAEGAAAGVMVSGSINPIKIGKSAIKGAKAELGANGSLNKQTQVHKGFTNTRNIVRSYRATSEEVKKATIDNAGKQIVASLAQEAIKKAKMTGQDNYFKDLYTDKEKSTFVLDPFTLKKVSKIKDIDENIRNLTSKKINRKNADGDNIDLFKGKDLKKHQKITQKIYELKKEKERISDDIINHQNYLKYGSANSVFKSMLNNLDDALHDEEGK